MGMETAVPWHVQRLINDNELHRNCPIFRHIVAAFGVWFGSGTRFSANLTCISAQPITRPLLPRPTFCCRYGNAPAPAGLQGQISIGMLIALVLWLATVGGATILMSRYSNTPGTGGLAPISWPVDSHLPFEATRPTLLMFAHPRCPCTSASLGELERLLAQVPGRLSAQVVFLKSEDTAVDWEKTDLWRKASSIPGVSVYMDNAGIEGRRFHSETSGQTLLYDPAGNLRFQGGITFARGHAGDNPGRTALQELLWKGHSNQVKTPVFGCSLFEAQCQKGNVVCKP